MKINRWIQSSIAWAIFCGVFAASATVFAQETATAHTVVTATTKANEASPTIPQDSIKVELSGKPAEVLGWVPLRGPRAGLQLVLLMDDSSRSSLSLQLNDLKNFIQGLPPATQVAIGYMRYGSANLVQGFTSDRSAAVKALRMPISSPGISASPYFCLSDLVKRWPMGSDVRREVIMVTDGVDRYSGRRYDPDDPYVQAAITDAQKAGVIVYSIYYKGAGRLDRSGLVTNGGQNYLIQVSQATGGEAYYQGFGDPVSFAPFLSDIQRKLENQYELSISAPPKKGLQPLRVKTNQPNTKLAAPSRIPVGGATPER